MTEDKIVSQYELIKSYYDKYLKTKNVKLPNLMIGNKYTKDALTLVFLSQNYPNTKAITKSSLTRFIQRFYPDVNDVQQARHLGAQKGWYIVCFDFPQSGTGILIHPDSGRSEKNKGSINPDIPSL